MKFGLQHPSFNYDGQGPEMVEALRKLLSRAESNRFDSFWVMDHFHQIRGIGDPHEPMLEGWTTQAVLAGFTSKIKLGTLVTGIVCGPPSLLSKSRLFTGIGAAWNQDGERSFSPS